jgi:hypothetical protein
MTEPPSVHGMTLCDLPLGTSKTGFPLGSTLELEIIKFEGKAENVAILRLDKSLPEQCAGRVIAELRMPPHGSEEFAFFPCSYSPRGGRKVTRIVGLGSNDNGRLVRFRPRLAWRVDVQSSRFVPVQSNKVICEWKGVD